MIGYSETSDLFGSGMTSCDFNRDGYAELAIGPLGETGPGDPDPNRGPRAAGPTGDAVVVSGGQGRRETTYRRAAQDPDL